ncbi:MAG TPA: DUF2723 domain-containing protein, partial [Chloroflexi bacterium]|nr:DUF2723 domain-containing protein [Chloroflexota bacterium]
MIESPTERPHLDEHSRPALIARLACAVWAGLPWGLALARLLYEIAPLRLAFLGGVWPSLALGMLGVAVWWGVMTRLPSGWEDATAACLPPALLWIHVLAPSLDVQPLRGAVLLAGTTMLSAVLIILRRGERSGSRHLPLPAGTLSVALIALAGYLLTLQRTIGRADTFEFQVTAPVLGVAHPTGYPLFILLGKAFSLLPLGMVATRVNLVSAIAAAVAVALVYETLRRALRVNGIIPVLAALAFAFSPTFWSQAVVAEVYALHNAFAAAILGGALWLAAQGGGDGQAEVVPRVMVALLALVGFSLANHLTTVLLLPALAAAILIARPRLTAKQWALGAGLLGAGLLLYAYIPLRWPALHDGRLMSLDEFVGWVTGSRFSGALQLRAWLDDPERWRIVGRLLLEQYGWPGIALGIVGLG